MRKLLIAGSVALLTLFLGLTFYSYMAGSYTYDDTLAKIIPRNLPMKQKTRGRTPPGVRAPVFPSILEVGPWNPSTEQQKNR